MSLTQVFDLTLESYGLDFKTYAGYGFDDYYSNLVLKEGHVLPEKSAMEKVFNEKKIDRAWILLREERNRLLTETDWMGNSDVTISAKQKSYRKELRDLPSIASPELDDKGFLTNITWPTKPE